MEISFHLSRTFLEEKIKRYEHLSRDQYHQKLDARHKKMDAVLIFLVKYIVPVIAFACYYMQTAAVNLYIAITVFVIVYTLAYRLFLKKIILRYTAWVHRMKFITAMHNSVIRRQLNLAAMKLQSLEGGYTLLLRGDTLTLNKAGAPPHSVKISAVTKIVRGTDMLSFMTASVRPDKLIFAPLCSGIADVDENHYSADLQEITDEIRRRNPACVLTDKQQ